MKKLSTGKSISLFLGILLACFFIWIVTGQEDMIFHPTHSEEAYNQLKQHKDFREIKISQHTSSSFPSYTTDFTLRGWLKYNCYKNKKSPLVIMYGGNAQNSSSVFANYYNKQVFDYYQGYNVLMVDYPGYGKSDNKIHNQKDLFEKVLKVYDYASKQNYVDDKHIVIMGYSIGTGMASYVASQRDCDGLILLAPYDSFVNMYNNTLPLFYGPMKFLVKYNFNSIEYSKVIKTKPLIIASRDDKVIPYEQSENLAKSYKSIYKFVSLDSLSHGAILTNTTTLKYIKEYLSSKL